MIKLLIIIKINKNKKIKKHYFNNRNTIKFFLKRWRVRGGISTTHKRHCKGEQS